MHNFEFNKPKTEKQDTIETKKRVRRIYKITEEETKTQAKHENLSGILPVTQVINQAKPVLMADEIVLNKKPEQIKEYKDEYTASKHNSAEKKYLAESPDSQVVRIRDRAKLAPNRPHQREFNYYVEAER